MFVMANADNPDIDFCEVTSRSVLLGSVFFGDSVNDNSRLSVPTSALLTEDFNNPALGLYTDDGSSIMAANFAEQRCNAGLGGEEFSSTLDPDTGIAAVFSCFQ